MAQKRAQDEQEVAELVAKGEKPIKLVYHDGDTHESFRTALANVTGVTDTKLGYVSRTEGISSGPRVVALNDTGKEAPEAPPTALAFASMKEVPVPQAETRAAVTQQTAPVAAAAAVWRDPVLQEDVRRRRRPLQHLVAAGGRDGPGGACHPGQGCTGREARAAEAGSGSGEGQCGRCELSRIHNEHSKARR